MSYELSNKTKEILSKRIGIPYEKLITMEDVNKKIDEMER